MNQPPRFRDQAATPAQTDQMNQPLFRDQAATPAWIQQRPQPTPPAHQLQQMNNTMFSTMTPQYWKQGVENKLPKFLRRSLTTVEYDAVGNKYVYKLEKGWILERINVIPSFDHTSLIDAPPQIKSILPEHDDKIYDEKGVLHWFDGIKGGWVIQYVGPNTQVKEEEKQTPKTQCAAFLASQPGKPNNVIDDAYGNRYKMSQEQDKNFADWRLINRAVPCEVLAKSEYLSKHTGGVPNPVPRNGETVMDYVGNVYIWNDDKGWV